MKNDTEMIGEISWGLRMNKIRIKLEWIKRYAFNNNLMYLLIWIYHFYKENIYVKFFKIILFIIIYYNLL